MALREFNDEDGVTWQVWDVSPTLGVDATSEKGRMLSEDVVAGWLSFRSPGERRRFFQVPPGWENFTDEELCRLCRHAVAVPNPA
jgi:hypothetical protein